MFYKTIAQEQSKRITKSMTCNIPQPLYKLNIKCWMDEHNLKEKNIYMWYDG